MCALAEIHSVGLEFGTAEVYSLVRENALGRDDLVLGITVDGSVGGFQWGEFHSCFRGLQIERDHTWVEGLDLLSAAEG